MVVVMMLGKAVEVKDNQRLFDREERFCETLATAQRNSSLCKGSHRQGARL